MTAIPTAQATIKPPLAQIIPNVSVQPTVSTVQNSEHEPMDDNLEETLLNLGDSE